jgi:hypothetical protein
VEAKPLECGREAAAFVVRFVQGGSFAAALQGLRPPARYRVEFISKADLIFAQLEKDQSVNLWYGLGKE